MRHPPSPFCLRRTLLPPGKLRLQVMQRSMLLRRAMLLPLMLRLPARIAL
jgi:hypothetical protein